MVVNMVVCYVYWIYKLMDTDLYRYIDTEKKEKKKTVCIDTDRYRYIDVDKGRSIDFILTTITLKTFPSLQSIYFSTGIDNTSKGKSYKR